MTTESRYKTTPYTHQLECLNKFGREKYFALLAEMGTGKTWIVINNFCDLWSTDDCDAVLVFAPNGVHTNWTLKEIPQHVPDWVRYRCAAWSSTAKKEEKRKLDDLFKPPFDRELRILTMNWEALQTKRGFKFAEDFASSSNKLMIVCDESDAIKNPKAARTKALMKLKKHSAYRRIMTGTPVNNAPFDIFSQFSFLDSSILRTTSFYAFKAEYAYLVDEDSYLIKNIKEKTDSYFAPQIVSRDERGNAKYKNLEKLHDLISPHSYRVLKKDCLDLPDKIHKTLFFDLTKEQRAIYDKAANECRLVFEKEESPIHRLVAFTKLAQITSGYFIHPESNDLIRIDGKNHKLNLLVERVKAIANAGEKVIIWARFRVEIEDIACALRAEKIKCVEYHGGVKKGERVEAIDDFENGDAKVFVGNQQAGGTGITLVAASNVIYFSNNFSLRDRLQSEDRAHRIGQTKNVTYINICARDTIDEKITAALINKKDVASLIVDNKIIV